MTPFTFAKPAGDADGFKGSVFVQIQPVRIDKINGMAQSATQTNRVSTDRRFVGPPGFLNVACKAEIARAIGRFGTFTQETPRNYERAGDVPQTTCAAKTR